MDGGTGRSSWLFETALILSRRLQTPLSTRIAFAVSFSNCKTADGILVAAWNVFRTARSDLDLTGRQSREAIL